MPPIQPQTEGSKPTQTEGSKPTNGRLTGFAGILALLLIFVAAGSLTWTYLSDTHPQTASAAQTVQPPPPLADPNAFEGLGLSAKSAIVVDITNQRALYQLNPDAQWPLASLTKVALTLAVADALSPQSQVTIPFDTGYNSHSTGGLHTGETWTLQDVIDFTLAASSNDGADILARLADPTIKQRYPFSPAQGTTVWRMNDLAASLGLNRTYFLNDNGLDLSATQSGAYGSARDVAALFAYAASSTPEMFRATRVKALTLRNGDGSAITVTNTDDALPDLPNLIVGKTGYTDLAGGNLAVVFRLDNHLISIVVLGSTYDGRFDDMKKLAAATKQALGLK
jgi:D-alanyl-D-alanine carboxypeptidase (penicillin-binding protein 5/6)